MITTISEVQSSVDKVESTVGRFPKLLQAAIGKATGLITGQSGGYVVIHTAEENGQPYTTKKYLEQIALGGKKVNVLSCIIR